ncbi:MAG: hypothetical protein ACOYOE_03135 [Chlorobium sp.]
MIKILATPDIESAMQTLSDLSAEIFHAPAPSLFLLSTQQSAFVGVFGKQKGFAQMDDSTRRMIGAVIEEIYRRCYVRNFFTYIQHSVDFTNQDTYFRDIARHLSDILSMEMVAIRQINATDNLDCRAFFHS